MNQPHLGATNGVGLYGTERIGLGSDLFSHQRTVRLHHLKFNWKYRDSIKDLILLTSVSWLVNLMNVINPSLIIIVVFHILFIIPSIRNL